MIRKLWLDLRWQFWILLGLLLLILGLYTWSFTHSKIFEYNDDLGYGLVVGPGDYSELIKEHPTGRLFSASETPGTYFVGIEGLSRLALPLFAVLFSLGGTLTEKNDGTASFSLSFPITRLRWLMSRAAVLLGLMFVLSLIVSSVALAIGGWLGVGGLRWFFTAPFLLTLGCVPGIGLSFFAQSWFCGRLNNAIAETVLAGSLTALGVVLMVPFGPFLPGFTPVQWVFGSYLGALYPAKHLVNVGAAAIVGVVGFWLAVRRFERIDF